MLRCPDQDRRCLQSTRVNFSLCEDKKDYIFIKKKKNVAKETGLMVHGSRLFVYFAADLML